MTAPNSGRLQAYGAEGFLSLEVTTCCNSPCRHCFARAAGRAETRLSPALAEAACREGYGLGYRHLHLTGGEPLLWPALFDLLALVGTLGYQSVFLNTNGLLLTEAAAARLARLPGLAVSVTLQGPAALHDAMRGAGTHRRAARGIRHALAAGLPTSVFAVVGQRLLAQLASFAAAANDRFQGIERLTLIQLMGVEGQPQDVGEDLLDPAAFVRLVRTVSALNLCGYFTHVLNNPLVNAAAELLEMPLVPRSAPLCRPGKLMINADGQVVLAHSTARSLGRYKAGMLAAVLRSPEYEAALAPDAHACAGCRFSDICRRHAMQRPSEEMYDDPAPEPYCQRVLARCQQQD